MAATSRVVVLIDMDCFYCQVEELLDPNLKDKPIAVVQYNAWRGGGIIAVNYPARDEGVTRHMRGAEAKKKCPSINLVQVPELRGKADLTKYRDAGKRVADVLQTFTPMLERASVDEAYLDITELVNKRMEENLENLLQIERVQNTYVVGCETQDFLDCIKSNSEFLDDNLKLAVGAIITEEIRAEIFKLTGYKCSAGIAHNKILAKLVCSLHKPNKQTVLPQKAVEEFFQNVAVHKIKSLGGKFGQKLVDDLNITTMSDLAKFSEKELTKFYDQKTANWLFNIARGIDFEPVTPKLISKSIGACKNFPGKQSLNTSEAVEHWISELSQEISERLIKDLEENNRKAKNIVVSFTQEIGKKDVHSSRTTPLTSYDVKRVTQTAFDVIKKFCMKADGSYCVKFLGISASNFEKNQNVREITSFFTKNSKKDNNNDKKIEGNVPKQAVEPVEVKNGKRKSRGGDITSFFTRGNRNLEPTENNKNINDIYSVATDDENEDSENLQFYELDRPVMEFKEEKEKLEFVHPYDDDKCESLDNYNYSKLGNSSTIESKDEEMEIDSNYKNTEEDLENDKLYQSCSNFKERMTEHSPMPTCSFFDKYFQDPTNAESNNYDLSDDENDIEDYPEIEENATEICPDCGENVLKSEMISHQDYHLAMKIANEEKIEENVSNVIQIQSNKEVKINKSKKRKQCDISTKSNIIGFLKKNNEEIENGELCNECNKKIKLEDWESHMDYHAAKRLHLELNCKAIPAVSNALPKNKTVNATKNLKSFFKVL